MTIRAPSSAPTVALPIWTDGRDIYVELPGPGVMTTTLRYPLTASGLGLVLSLIRERAHFDGLDRTPPPIRAAGTAASPSQYQRARDLLRTMRVIR